MFREMRRKKQLLALEESTAVLECGTSGVLAVLGDHGYPYAVPISYVYDGAHIYFHCAKAGHKLDAVKRNQKASFCVIGKDEVGSSNLPSSSTETRCPARDSGFLLFLPAIRELKKGQQKAQHWV